MYAGHPGYHTVFIKQCACSFQALGSPQFFLKQKQSLGYFSYYMLLKKIMYKYKCRKLFWQGPKKVPSSGPGQIDFVAGQVTVKADLHNKQGSRQKSAKEIIK